MSNAGVRVASAMWRAVQSLALHVYFEQQTSVPEFPISPHPNSFYLPLQGSSEFAPDWRYSQPARTDRLKESFGRPPHKLPGQCFDEPRFQSACYGSALPALREILSKHSDLRCTGSILAAIPVARNQSVFLNFFDGDGGGSGGKQHARADDDDGFGFGPCHNFQCSLMSQVEVKPRAFGQRHCVTILPAYGTPDGMGESSRRCRGCGNDAAFGKEFPQFFESAAHPFLRRVAFSRDRRLLPAAAARKKRNTRRCVASASCATASSSNGAICGQRRVRIHEAAIPCMLCSRCWRDVGLSALHAAIARCGTASRSTVSLPAAGLRGDDEHGLRDFSPDAVAHLRSADE